MKLANCFIADCFHGNKYLTSYIHINMIFFTYMTDVGFLYIVKAFNLTGYGRESVPFYENDNYNDFIDITCCLHSDVSDLEILPRTP